MRNRSFEKMKVLWKGQQKNVRVYNDFCPACGRMTEHAVISPKFWGPNAPAGSLEKNQTHKVCFGCQRRGAYNGVLQLVHELVELTDINPTATDCPTEQLVGAH